MSTTQLDRDEPRSQRNWHTGGSATQRECHTAGGLARPVGHIENAGDYGLDLIVHVDGSTEWKDVDHLNAMMRSHRMTGGQGLEVLAAADEVSGLLHSDQRWWSGWVRWTLHTELQ